MFQFLPGDLVEIIERESQSPLFKKAFIGQVGIIINKVSRKKGAANMYKTHVDNRSIHLHCLDMKLLSRVE
jgi:ribosomal protein L21E